MGVTENDVRRDNQETDPSQPRPAQLLDSTEDAGGFDAWLRAQGVTPHEHQAVALVERGLTNAEIARVLDISANTGRNQIASVFRKLDVTRRAELVYVLGRAAARDA